MRIRGGPGTGPACPPRDPYSSRSPGLFSLGFLCRNSFFHRVSIMVGVFMVDGRAASTTCPTMTRSVVGIEHSILKPVPSISGIVPLPIDLSSYDQTPKDSSKRVNHGVSSTTQTSAICGTTATQHTGQTTHRTCVHRQPRRNRVSHHCNMPEAQPHFHSHLCR
jgi:hypothetical protein